MQFVSNRHLQVFQRPKGVYMTQNDCIDNVLESFKICKSEPKSVPLSAGNERRLSAYPLEDIKKGKYPYRELFGSLL